MTEQKHRKALIRARMARTGESYTVARSHIVAREIPPSLTPTAAFQAHDRHCMTVVFTPDDQELISGGFGGQARIWTLDGRPAGELAGHEQSVNVVRISADGETAITASSDKTVRVWDLPTRSERGILGRHRRQILSLDLDAARGRAWSGGHDGRLIAWDLERGDAIVELDLGTSVTALAVRASDGAVLAGTAGGGIAIVDPDGALLTRLGDPAAVIGSASWAADGSFLIASTRDGSTIWAADGWEAVRTLVGGSGSMLPVALSPDGSRIALGWDNHLGLWSADESAPAVTVDGLPKGVYGLSFSHDGRHLAMSAADGRVRLWSVT